MIRNTLLTLVSVCLMLWVSACGNGAEKGTVIISTEHGEIHIKLYDETPQHRDNFIKLAKEGFYDGLLFHRVIQGFMIQGGDPDSKEATAEKMLGNGGPGYELPAEIVEGKFHKRGALAAARLGDDMNPEKKSSGSQFYIVHGKTFTKEEMAQMKENKVMQKLQALQRSFINRPENSWYMQLDFEGLQQRNPDSLRKVSEELQKKFEAEFPTPPTFEFTPEQMEIYTTIGGAPFLDAEYTVFGEVIKGMEVVDKIAAEPVGTADRPNKNISFTVKIVE
jgi:cyclophilin family peptidyl-prolyl cis-trans isomerase